jgi:hypothetical protein
MIHGDNKYRPRRKSKKMKAKEQELKAIQRQRARERKDDIKNMKTWTPSAGNYRRDAGVHIPSHQRRETAQQDKLKTAQHNTLEMSPEMIEREEAAQAEIERKKKCVAPLYNKGTYQPVWTEDQAKDVGR